MLPRSDDPDLQCWADGQVVGGGRGTAAGGADGVRPAGRAKRTTRRRTAGRLSAAAHARGIPLATIVTTIVVAFAILDLNFLVILLLWVLRTILLYVVVAFFIALLLSPAVHLVQRAVPSRAAWR